MNSEKLKVAVIGTGNVGTQFARIFGTEPVSPRTLYGLPDDADIYVISVSDSAVKEVADRLPELPGIVVHTTGSVPMDALACVKCGQLLTRGFHAVTVVCQPVLRRAFLLQTLPQCNGCGIQFVLPYAAVF